MKNNRIIHYIANLDLHIAVLALATLIAVTFCGVIWRYLVSRPFIWQEEVQLALIIWVVCFGGSAVFRKGGHVAIDMFVDLLPAMMQKFLKVVVYLVVMAALGYLLYNAWTYVAQMAGKNRVTNILRIPYWLIYGSLPASLLLMAANFTYATLCKKELSAVEAAIEGGAGQ